MRERGTFLPSQREAITTIRSPLTDHRLYRYILLPNQLKVMLISDAKADEASASMNVHVGSTSSINSVPGVAHFTEHMLFMGSERYPEEDDYFTYMNEHAGYANAWTSQFNTAYQFSVGPKYLDGALDRLSQFFIAPLMKAEAVGREMRAVDSEFTIGQTKDSRKLWELFRQSPSKPGHPWSLFTCGNLKSLRDFPLENGWNIHNIVHEFHETWYSSNTMALAVYGPQDLDTLEGWTRKYFNPVVNTNILPPQFGVCGTPEGPISAADEGTQMFVVPVSELHQARFMFHLPPLFKKWKTKPATYVSHMLSHKGPKSLESALRREGLILSVDAGGFYGAESWDEICTSYQVLFNLSDLGNSSDGITRIGQVLFAFIADMRNTLASQSWRFDEFKNITEALFDYADMKSAYKSANALSEALQLYTVPELLGGPSLFYEYDQRDLAMILNSLRLDKLRLLLVDQKYKSTATKKDRWYGTSYFTEPLDSNWRAAWSEIENMSAEETSEYLQALQITLPPKNRFVPGSITPPNTQGDSSLIHYPNPIEFEGGNPCHGKCRLYYKQDTMFGMPKTRVRLNLHSEYSMDGGIESLIRTELFLKTIKPMLDEDFYDAKIAGIGFSVKMVFASTGAGRVQVEVKGFSEGVLRLLPALLLHLSAEASGGAKQHFFDAALQNVDRSLKDLVHSPSISFQSTQTRYKGLVYPYYTPQQIYDVFTANEWTIDDVKLAAKNIWKSVAIEGLIMGDVGPTEASAALFNGIHLLGVEELKSIGEIKEIKIANLMISTTAPDPVSPSQPLVVSATNSLTNLAMTLLQTVWPGYSVIDATTDAPVDESAVSPPADEESEASLTDTQPPLRLRYRTTNLDKEDSKNIVLLTMQLGSLSLSDRAKAVMISQWLRQPFFASLRTKKQLGYSVRFRRVLIEHVSILEAYVQGSYEPAQVTTEIEEFMHKYLQGAAEELTDEHFDTMRNSACQLLEKKPNNVKEEFKNHFKYVADHSYLFDKSVQIVKHLRAMTKDDVVAFVKSRVLTAPWLLIEIRSVKTEPKEIEGYTERQFDTWEEIDDITNIYDRSEDVGNFVFSY
eukprot:GHVT01074309.1.p1 GENE.GHVT01074309.1~~GHVT01074309.1.p1  ORF type:complete len:1077 (+),score=114.94 GHVT01074309.1:1353-4583(+)